MPALTIIIPTFNSAKTLANCLDSIINQNFRDFEVFFIDSISTDATLNIIEQYQKEYGNLKYISEKDDGIYHAMNKGLKHALGDWIYFMGSDDELYNENVIRNFYDFAKEHNCNIAYGNVEIKGDCNWAKNGQIYDGYFDLKKLVCQNISHQAVFYKRSFLNNYNLIYNTKYYALADWDFNLRCFSKTNFLYIDMIVAKFKVGGASSNQFTSQDPLYDDFFENYLKYFKLSPFDNKISWLPKIFLKQRFLKQTKYLLKHYF